MNLQIDHNLLHDIDNKITRSQWNELMQAVIAHTKTSNQPADVLYIGSRSSDNSKRYYCYDNYDRFYMPGLDLQIDDNADVGTLTTYSSSEQARAPITFEQGMQISQNFFNEYGGQMAEEIVCEWLMDGNPSIF